MLAQRPRPSFTGTPNDGSRTITIHDVPTPEADRDDTGFSSHPRPALKLRGGPSAGRRVAWGEEVIDNEDCGRKKSKICCIYHKPKRFDESSDESSDDESDTGRARPARRAPRHDRSHHHHHMHDNSDETSSGASSSGSERQREGASSTIVEQPATNAYEPQPRRPKDDKAKGI